MRRLRIAKAAFALALSAAVLVPTAKQMGLCAIVAQAEEGEEKATSGEAGDCAIWSYEDGVLTFELKPDIDPNEYNVRHRGIGMNKYQGYKIYADTTTKVVVKSGISRIQANAFMDFSELTTVELPDDLETIFNDAFTNCSKLENINWPEGLLDLYAGSFSGTAIKSAEFGKLFTGGFNGNPFPYCDNLESITVDPENPVCTDGGCNVVMEKETEVVLFGCKESVIPEDAKEIGQKAFWGSNIRNVVLPVGYSRGSGCHEFLIREKAFYDSQIVSVKSNADIMWYGSGAFDNCSKLKCIDAPYLYYSKVEEMEGCVSLTEYKNEYTSEIVGGMPGYSLNDGNVDYINVYVKYMPDRKHYPYLSSRYKSENPISKVNVYFEGSESQIADIETVSLPNVTVRFNSYYPESYVEDSGSYTSEDGKTIHFVYGDGILGIDGEGKIDEKLKTLYKNHEKDVKKVIIAGDVTEIGYGAFTGCTNLEEVVFEAPVTKIGGYAFAGCKQIKTLDLPDSLETISSYAFMDMGLETLIIPKNVSEIGNSPFALCESLVNLGVEEGNSYWISKGNGLYDINNPTYLVKGCLTTAIEPGTTRICKKSFENTGMTSLIIPDGVEYIEGFAIQESELKEIYLPKSIKTIKAAGIPKNNATIYYDGTKEEWSKVDTDGVTEYEVIFNTDNSHVGWVQINGKWEYYDENHEAVIGWLTYKNKWYYMNEDGIMQTGWVKYNNKWYFLGSSGAMCTGWLERNGKWYYLDKNGAMKTGWLSYNGKWYYFSPSGKDEGVMATRWKQINGKWYYFNASGSMITGWKQFSDKWYYFNADGEMQVGVQTIKGRIYLFDEDAGMLTGWQNYNDKWYYFEKSGIAKIGWATIDNKIYYFHEDGHMAQDELIPRTVGHGYLQADGTMAIEDGWYGKNEEYYIKGGYWDQSKKK